MAKVRVNWGSLDEGEVVQVYCVYNSSHKHLYILAKDEGTALRIAHTANHIYDTKIIHADHYGRNVYVAGKFAPPGLLEHQGALDKAIAERVQGTLHWDDDHLSVGYEVIEE